MTFQPAVIIFDVDGVLVDTRGSFQRTTLETVKFFVGKRVTRRELHRWKNRPGFNDDWKLSTAWVNALGKKIEYDEVKGKFVEIYWGKNGKGNGTREKWLLPAANLRRSISSPAGSDGSLITLWIAADAGFFSTGSSA